MEKFGKSQPVRRVEDVRFLTGKGRYVDDIVPAGALQAFFLRAPVGHGIITEMDTSMAEEAEGVALVLTADSFKAAGFVNEMDFDVIELEDGEGAAPPRPVLADGRVRFVGEPVAMIVAETLAQARDAAEMISLEVDDLPCWFGPGPGGEDIHPEAPGNLAYDWSMGDEAAVEAALAASDRVVTVELPDNRVAATPMEPRGCYVEMEGGRLHMCFNGQGVWGAKDEIAACLGMEASEIRVTNPDVGGGFGLKGATHPEQLAIAAAAKMLGRTVHWMGERTEGFLSDNGGRDLVSTATLGFDAEGRITAYKVETLSNLGAYNSNYGQFIQSELFSKVAPGTYAIDKALLKAKGYYTNSAPVDAYRGAGRPEAIFVLEHAMGHAALQLGIDPFELRRRNFIPPDSFPYTSATGVTYDVGEFAKVLSRAEEHSDVAGFEARKAESEAAGKLRGLGLCYYIESILGDKQEFATVVFGENEVELHVGTQSNGQGHETVFAKFLSDQTGIPMSRIRVVMGDSDIIEWGGGTGGSRSVTMQNTATLAAKDGIAESFGAFLAEREGVDPAEVTFDDERFRLPGSNLSPTMLEVAEMAREAGRDDLLKQTHKGSLRNMSFPNGAHVAEVEIDPETGVTKVVRYTVTDDFGVLINPMLAEGQVHGGVAQGIGQALTERVVFDEEGQLLTATFMDYALPRAEDVPMIAFHHEGTPSTFNAMGMKGCGEAGTVGALAAISNAMLGALAPLGVSDIAMPFTPERVWRAIEETRVAAA
ncbi:xanthine dehydrogenase family protein molybdopterin-binding subunit [Pseudoroseicyclus tamaricis]|uniref:Xanthine dehydrogenase family protein molybdopterin-binding subunit n=1 Tax=Pseudoroseicyclus tamaricis TaxID=2705421 RepID=A0A6B2JZM2_9RHOB|nr:xanthine dehydrogenase family protein molybdopterin-binding subunit [Pseudoroseicyclus tamaricis]NDV02099.1 xanthine dehydrogenase family protein molybdopterin-binding subunit [Pseudoroseicyclus tamaricis]